MLIITGDTHPAHDWKATTPALREVLSSTGKIEVDVTSTPSKDLTEANLAKYDVLLLNYLNYKKPVESPDTTWTDANKSAFLKAIHDEGKGLVVIHHASGSFARPNWVEFEKAVGGWRTQGFHGPAHEFTVKKTAQAHPISAGAPAEFAHVDRRTLSEQPAPARQRRPGDRLLRPLQAQGDRQGRGRHLGEHLWQRARLRERPGPRRRHHQRPRLPDLDPPRQ